MRPPTSTSYAADGEPNLRWDFPNGLYAVAARAEYGSDRYNVFVYRRCDGQIAADVTANYGPECRNGRWHALPYDNVNVALAVVEAQPPVIVPLF